MKGVFIYFLFITIGCSSFKPQSQNFDQCILVQSILDYKEVNEILGLNDSIGIRPFIRIFDFTGVFKICNSFYKQSYSSLPVPYFVEQELKPSINTGIYRDIVIHRYNFKKGSNEGDIILSAATFKTHNGVNTNFRIALKYKIIGKQTAQIIDSKITEYIDKPPPYNYDK